MKKWLVISRSPQTLLPCWTYCGHCKTVGRAFLGLVCLGTSSSIFGVWA